MKNYLLRRLLVAIPTLFGVLTTIFVVLRVIPGDVAASLLGEAASYERVQALRQALGMDKPLWLQYLDYLGGVVRGDLGRAIFGNRPVAKEILDLLPATVQLALAGVLVAVVVGVPLGVLSAVKRNSAFDHVLRVVALFGVSVPSFWLGLLLIWLFGLNLGWLPIFGGGELSNLVDNLRHLVLPASVLGLGMSALIMRMTRSCMLEVIGQDYIRTARAKGLAETGVIFRHALKNAMIPIVTIIGLDIGHLLGGTVIIESVFARPGLGKFMIDAINSRDYPQAQGAILVLATSFIAVNLLTDVVYSYCDPRIKYG